MAGTNPPKIPVLAVITHLLTGLARLPSLLIQICGILISSKDPVNCHCVACPLTTLQQTLQHRNVPTPPSTLRHHPEHSPFSEGWQGMGTEGADSVHGKQVPGQGRAGAAMGLNWATPMTGPACRPMSCRPDGFCFTTICKCQVSRAKQYLYPQFLSTSTGLFSFVAFLFKLWIQDTALYLELWGSHP